ncbi:MAG: hypothetical protein M3063_02700 [Actinomycetota bacterium]|nr:hypothetical protein [Actinomycetota bacterium]
MGDLWPPDYESLAHRLGLRADEGRAGAEAPDTEALSPTAPPSDLFVPLAEQIENVRRWNAWRRWGFTPDEIDAIDVTPRPRAEPLVVDIIAIFVEASGSLDGIRRTCDDLWLLAADRQPNSWCWDGSYWNQPGVGHKPVRLLDGLVHRPGVRRVTIDLGAHWAPGRYVRPASFRGKDAAHAEVLAAAAHFPRWVRAMDGKRVPHAWLPGYEVTVPVGSRHPRLPCLSWTSYRRMLSLTSHEADYSQSGWAAPVHVA